MKKQLNYHVLLVLLILVQNWTPTGHAIAASPLLINSKILTAGRAIANWPSGIPGSEKHPVLIFLPGWGGVGAVNASVSAQNTNLVNEGYVTLAIGFDSSATWISDIDVKTLQGLDKLCADAAIPANCNAVVLDGESYGGAQNYWVIEYLRSNGYDGSAGSKGRVLGFISEDAGYGAPGTLTNPTTGAFTRTGLADTASYAVALIQNLGDTTFPVDECTWGNCGARVLSNAHLAGGASNVFSICPPGGEHGTRGFANWNAWVISAIKTMIHVTYAIPAFTGYTAPTLAVSNACVNAAALPGLSVSGINITANGQPVRLRGVNMGDPFGARNPLWYPMYSTADYANLSQNWHANVVRISIFPTQWKNMDHATLLAGLAQEVNAALNNGLYVIISYHVIGWPNGFYQSACCGNAADTYDSSMSVATSFWTQMAQTYGSDTRIIFDLWNEPVHDSSDWQHADPNPFWAELKSFYENLIQTVRNNGAQNIVLATGNSWANWLVGIKDNPLSDSNVVYAYHQYSVEGSNTAAEWNKNTGGLIGVKPVIVSEWGYEDADVTNPTWPGTQSSYGIPFTQWMENNNLSNLAWMYHHDWTPALLKGDGGLTLYGTFIKNYIVQNNYPQYPTVTSIPCVNANPTAASSVNFTVIFSEPVTGVDTGDFSLTTSGISGAAVSGVSGSGNSYIVTVNTGSGGSGTIRLDVVDNNSIMDASFNPLGGAAVGDGNFTTGEVYTINRNIETYIGGVLRGGYLLGAGESTRQNYAGVDSGPVKVVHTDGTPIVSAIREAWAVNGVTTSFFQMMGLPQEQLSDTYVFPGYNNVTLNEQLRISNVDSVSSTVTVTIGGVLRGTYPLAVGEAVRINYAGLDSGPVVVQGTTGVKIISAIREAWAVNGVTKSFVQLMGLPKQQLSDQYVFPGYNNVTLNEQLRIGNVDSVESTVTVTIGGVLRGTYTLQPNEAVRVNYAGVDSGPVVVEGTTGVKIISAIREAWAVNGVTTSFAQLMGLPSGQLSNKYVFPGYNNVTLNEQLRIGNVDTVESTVTVTIGGVLRGTYTLQPNEAVRVNYAGVDSGPVVVEGTTGVKIISAIREAWAVNGVTQSFVQLMGLPSGQLSSTFWFPAYNNVTLNEQLRIAVP
jgi:hypothetical protein